VSGPLARNVAAASSLLLLACALLGASDAGAERASGGGAIVALDLSFSPKQLPRHGSAPIAVALSGGVRGMEGARPPRLAKIELAFGSRGGLVTRGLPTCPRSRLRNATSQQALGRCRAALVGRGTIEAEVPLDPQKPLIARARVLAFNGRSGGRPAVWLHAYSASPPVSFVLPFYVRRPRAGAFGVLLRAPVASALGRWPRLRSFEVTLGRRYRAGGSWRSYLNASCPLPPALHASLVPAARATYVFSPRPTLSVTNLRRCRVSE
jgi:hypothetical protein